jgi:hypothetical protein
MPTLTIWRRLRHCPRRAWAGLGWAGTTLTATPAQLRKQPLKALRYPLRAGVIAVAALALVAGAAGAAAAAAAPASMAPALGGAAEGGAVIVVLKSQHTGLSLRAHGSELRTDVRSDQASVMSSIRASRGTGVIQLIAPSSVAATLSVAEVAKLRASRAVARIIPDPQVRVAPVSPASRPLVKKVAVHHPADPDACPFNPAGPPKPLQEPEADTDIHASDGNPAAPDMANSIATGTGTGVVVANEGMNELAGNPNFTRADRSHVVIDAPDHTVDHGNDEFYDDASSIAAQGTVTYQYSGALPNAGIPADCTFYIKGDAPGASLVDLSADGPESVQFTASFGGAAAVASVPISRRTLIPSSGGSFKTLITSTVGCSIGQVNTYDINVPSGAPQLTVNLQTADVSPNNKITYYLVDPTGTVVATASTPNSTAGQAPGAAMLTAPSPVPGTWEIDVELGLTVSGSEFTQTVNATVSDSGGRRHMRR